MFCCFLPLIYGRFARCPVRPESFRPEYEVVSPGLRVDLPDINYALYFSKGASLTDCNQPPDVLCRSMDESSLLSRHLDSSTS